MCHHADPNIHGVVRHGTGVASLIGENTRGVAKNVTLVPVKVFSCVDGLSSQLATARGLDWIQSDMATRRSETQPLSGPRALVNMSMYFESNTTIVFPGHTLSDGHEMCEDGGGFTNCMSAIEHEVNELVRKEIPVITSANNNGRINLLREPRRHVLRVGARFRCRCSPSAAVPDTHRSPGLDGTRHADLTAERYAARF